MACLFLKALTKWKLYQNTKKQTEWGTSLVVQWLSPWGCKELDTTEWLHRTEQKGNQPWILVGRTDVETESPVFWSPDENSQLIGKVPDAGKDGGQKEKRASEDEMAGWHHWCNGNELGQTSGDGEGQGDLVCCSPSGCKQLDMTRWLNNSDNNIYQNSDHKLKLMLTTLAKKLNTMWTYITHHPERSGLIKNWNRLLKHLILKINSNNGIED